MPELAGKRTLTTVNVAYFEGPDVYRISCDDPDLDTSDINGLDVDCEDDARRIQREIVLRLEALGRTVTVEHWVVPEAAESDTAAADGRCHVEPLRQRFLTRRRDRARASQLYYEIVRFPERGIWTG